MELLVKSVIKFILVKPANCMKDLLSTEPQLGIDSAVSDHFNNICPDMDYLKITPLEHVPLEIERDPRDLDSFDMMKRLRYWSETRSERVSILKCQQKWIKNLKSKKQYGMNKRRVLPPPIIFSLTYMDETSAINNLVKSCYKKLQISSGNQSGIPMTRQLICTSKRNWNLKDMFI